MSTPSLPIRGDNPELFTRRQVASIVGVDHSTISRWEKKGLISPAQRYAGICLYTQQEIDKIKEVVEAQKTNPPDQIICTVCNRRKARQGTTLCSRCTITEFKQSLRSTLPGMEGSQDIAEEENSEGGLVIPLSDPVPGVKYYSRSEVAALIGVSPSTIGRWERKGATPLPIRLSINNQYAYAEEDVNKILDYAEQMMSQMRTPIERAAKLATKSFSRAEKAVAVRIKNISGRGIL